MAGLNKDDATRRNGEQNKSISGEDLLMYPPPGGESLKNTAERVLPYFESKILPEVIKGKNVLIAAHGNSLRALVMKLEDISPDEIVKLEIATGDPLTYECSEGKIQRTI